MLHLNKHYKGFIIICKQVQISIVYLVYCGILPEDNISRSNITSCGELNTFLCHRNQNCKYSSSSKFTSYDHRRDDK